MRFVAALIMLAIAGVGVWEWTSPHRTVAKLGAAAAEGDTVGLREAIAFDSVRSNLRADARDRLERMAGADPGLIESLGVAFGDALVGEAIDALVSPAGFAMLTRGGIDFEGDVHIDRTGVNTFIVELDDGSGHTVPLEFRRQGFGWRLVRIRLDR